MQAGDRHLNFYETRDNLPHGLGAWVAVRQPLPIGSKMLKPDEEITRQRLALGYTGCLARRRSRGPATSTATCSSRSPNGTC